VEERVLPRVGDPARLTAVWATGLLDSPPEAAFDELAGLAARLLGAPFAFVTLVDEQRSYWKARIGIEPDGPSQNAVEESFCQYVIASGEPLIADDVTADPLTAANPSIESMGVRAWAGFPLLSPNGESLGSFCVVDTVVRAWTEQDIETLRVLSGAAGREIALRSSVARAGVAARQLELLADAGHMLSGTLDAGEAVARLARLVVPTLGDWSLVSLAGADGTLTDVGWWHAREAMRPVLDKFAAERLVGLEGSGATIAAQRGRQPVVLDAGALAAGLDVLVSEQARDAYRELDPGGYGIWPLAFGDTVHGVLVVARDAGRPPFTAAQIELAGNLADRAGTVLDNAHLYAQLQEASRHDRIVSRALQDAMLTRLPEPDHLHIAARYRTADLHDQVGGDWYDALLPPGGATTLIVGDVAGHDIAAATVMGQLRNLLRALAWERDDEPPAALITRLDRVMAYLGLTTMTTLVVARIEQAATDARQGLRTLRWSTAGHPVPVLIDADGHPRLLHQKADPPVGISCDRPRHDHVTRIGPDQTLLLYTDGLLETRGEDIDARHARLLEVLESVAGARLDEMLDLLLAGMVGDTPDDDVALIAVRFFPEDEPRPLEAGPTSD
jgi:GAF domain-containing protein